jgi:predicted permease
LEPRLLGFTLAVSAATALLFGLAPALRATRVGIVLALKPGAPGSARGGSVRFRGGLLIAQLAGSVVLLAAGALLARSLVKLRTVDRGFSTDDVVLINVGTGDTRYTGDRAPLFYQNLISRAEALPGVQSASLGANAIFGSGHWQKSIWVQGRPAEEGQSAVFNVVTPGFFATTGLPLLLGRDFSVHDRLDSAPVAIVNEAFARRYCPGRPLGCRFGDRGPESSGKYEVIGIVKNAKYGALREEYEPMIYHALLQEDRASSVVLHVRAKESAQAIAARVRDECRAIDQTIPVYGARSMKLQIDESLSRDRLMALLSSLFALLAALLSGIGVFGIVANGVQGRRREIGVRMALGARRSDVLRLVLSQTIVLVSIGAVAGTVLAFVSTRVLAGSLFELSPTDPAMLSAAVLFLVVLAGTAAYLPARRATTLDPMVVLRQE